MQFITASQIRAARAILDWSQDDLAAASKLSRGTIRSVEMGYALRPNNIHVICLAFENNGIEFLEPEGVQRQSKDIKSIRGPNSCDRLFADILKTVKEKGGEVMCQIDTKEMLLTATGLEKRNNFERLEALQKDANVLCLLSDSLLPPPFIPSFQLRVVSEEPSSYFSYGDKWVYAYQDDRCEFAFIVFHKTAFAKNCQKAFMRKWNGSKKHL